VTCGAGARFLVIGFHLKIRGLVVWEFDLRNNYLAIALAIFIAFVGYLGGSVALVHSFIVIVRIIDIGFFDIRVLDKSLGVAMGYLRVVVTPEYLRVVVATGDL
jgi:hypothetical protein